MQIRSLTLRGDVAELRCGYDDRFIVKSLPGRKWVADGKYWALPVSASVISDVRKIFPAVYTSCEIEAAVFRLQERNDAVNAVKDAGWQNATPIAEMPISVEPFQHQVAAFNVAMQLPSSALLMEMGTGKTLAAIAVMGRRYLDGAIRRVLIVAPASVCPVWPAEFASFADYPVDVRVLEGPTKKRAKLLAGWEPAPIVDGDEQDICEACGMTPQESRHALLCGCAWIGLPSHLQVAVVNYEAAWRMVAELAAWRPDMIVCDESQRIKTAGAQQSKAMHHLSKVAPFRMILTGTSVTQHPLDFFSQYKFLDASIFGDLATPFRSRYAIMGGFEGRQIVAYRELDDLLTRAHSIAFRVTKAEALDLPDQIDVRRYCELEGPARRVYDRVAKEAVAQLDSGDHVVANNVLTRLLRLQEITGGWVHGDDRPAAAERVSDAKMKLLAETLHDVFEDESRKVVVFARFRAEIQAIVDYLTDHDIGWARIWGDTPMNARGDIVEGFQTNPSVRVFVAQIQSAGLGITLTAADTAIFYSLDFSFANYDQARSRLHRIGQTRSVTNIHLLARGTVDEAVMSVLARKRNVADVCMGNWREIVDGREVVYLEEFAR